MRRIIIFLILCVTLSACEKEDIPVTLPAPGSLQNAVANMGINYDDQVYFDFETGEQKTVPYRAYDLAFEASPNGFHIYLNTGKFMFVANTGANDITIADSTGHEWKTDPD